MSKSNKTEKIRSLRREQTKAEEVVWKYLRNRNFENLKFRRQHPINRYIVDFLCTDYKLVIELDGKHHIDDPIQIEKDIVRDTCLKRLGYTILRFENDVAFNNIDIIFHAIKKHISNADKSLSSTNKKVSKRLKKKNYKILSTKKLTPAQKELFTDTNIRIFEHNAIHIEFTDFKVEEKIENAIITSQNAAKAILNAAFNIQNCYCVGEKTKAILAENGLKIAEIGQNSADLGQKIAKKHKNKHFTFFCGTKKREELPIILKANNISLKELTVYHTVLNPKTFKIAFDGILFFSPSAVESYALKNIMINEMCFCIGKTTASEVEKHTQNIIIANKPTIENVLNDVKKHYAKINTESIKTEH